ncbi:type II secretion system F family protein [Aneurinibacillus tyrosinisolvens]|uniref:type II secretion system F family protein n=1 Tax=Aneurinibacillus tyrosinisolvens TaxID=1443435 RepID=UPI0009E1CB2C|nr:type II secretion system F family protein [Aneurinibacillus tyrosinisolvens]
MSFNGMYGMRIKRQWSERKLANLSYRLSYLLDSGIPLLDSLDFAIGHFNGREKEQLLHVRQSLEEGDSLSCAVESMSVPSLFVSLIVAGEQHGHYASSLSFAARYYQRRAEWKHQIYQLLSYPFLLLLLSAASLWFLLQAILPQLASMYSTLGLSLPYFTRVFIAIVSCFSSYGVPSIAVMLLCAAGFAIVRRRPQSAEKAAAFLFTVPFFRYWLKLKYSHYFAMQTGLLLEAGVSILDICILFKNKAPWLLYRHLMEKAEVQLNEGRRLSDTMGELPYFIPELIRYIELGEEGGQVGACLLFYSGQVEEEIRQQIEKLLRWLEPLVLIAIGSIVLVIVLSFFLPVLHMIRSLN